ncbi:hypothetical protein KAH81_08895 [bacterium]|nr:hypothetical protein [bacterium]
MKKMILLSLVMIIAASVILADGTVRVFTGNEIWCYSDFPNPTLIPAVNVPQYDSDPGPNSPWDPWNENVSPPRPWRKLYDQSPRDDGFWIGMRDDGRDIVAPNDRDTLWFYSPTFQLYSNISRATIWLSADDVIDIALLRNLTTNVTYAMPCVPVNGFTRFARFDLTDLFRSVPYSGQGYRMEFRVRNTAPVYIGMIGYMSYDYGASRNYSYILSGSGWRYVSMPFKPTNPAATLRSLFPGIGAAEYYNWASGWQSLNIDAPLSGSLGDITRTYTFKVHYRPTGSHNTIIEGYPIFEQRYLDLTTNNDLYFGTINCDCPPGYIGYIRFNGSYPDDMWPDKITGTTNWAYESDGISFSTPVYEVYPKKAYYAIPHTSCVGCGYPCLPYHLDIINYGCHYPSKSSPSEEYYSVSEDFIIDPSEERSVVEFTDADLALIDWIADSVAPYIHIPDSAEVCAHFPDLCEEIGRAKTTHEQPYKPVLSVTTYPSPFNSELTISVSIPNDDYLTMGIYNISGDLVRTLYTDEVQMGEHSFVWDGLDGSGGELPTGNYFARVATNAEISIVKVVLLK